MVYIYLKAVATSPHPRVVARSRLARPSRVRFALLRVLLARRGAGRTIRRLGTFSVFPRKSQKAIEGMVTSRPVAVLLGCFASST